MAEINAAKMFARKPSERGQTKPQTARARLSSLLTNESRQRRDGGSDGGDSSLSSESGDDEPRKRRKLQPSDMPWHSQKGEFTVPKTLAVPKFASLI